MAEGRVLYETGPNTYLVNNGIPKSEVNSSIRVGTGDGYLTLLTHKTIINQNIHRVTKTPV